jgi:hypothetical protein
LDYFNAFRIYFIERLNQLYARYSLDELTENKINDNRAVEASLDKISQADLEEPWIPDSAVGRAESLQSNAELNSIDRKTRRNDTLFIGKFLSSKA